MALSPNLKRLEAESIGIMREVAAEFRNPVMLYSIGKDSGVMLHLAIKAFHPSKPPFPRKPVRLPVPDLGTTNQVALILPASMLSEP